MTRSLCAALLLGLAAPAALAPAAGAATPPFAQEGAAVQTAGPAAAPVILEARRGRGADDPAGHERRGRGRGTDDGPNHG